MKLILLPCLAALVFNIAAEEKVNLCGSELAKARVLLCYGAEYVLKRSSADMEYKGFGDENTAGPLWSWSGRHAVQAAHWSRNKRRLVDECCLKPCTTDVILSYC